MRKGMWLSCVVVAMVAMTSMLILSGCAEENGTYQTYRTGDGSTIVSDQARDGGTGAMQKRDVIIVARDAGRFSTFDQLVDRAGLTGTLKGEGQYTVFAPNDDAFNKLPANVLDNLKQPQHRDHLRQILQYHIASGKMTSRDLKNMDRFDTLGGRNAKLSTRDGALRVDNAQVITADIRADNGIIHEIDTVLIPNNLQDEVRKMESQPVRARDRQADQGTDRWEADQGTDQATEQGTDQTTEQGTDQTTGEGTQQQGTDQTTDQETDQTTEQDTQQRDQGIGSESDKTWNKDKEIRSGEVETK